MLQFFCMQDTQKNPKRRRLLHHDTMDIFSVAITARGSLHPWRFNMFMKDLYTERHEDIFRSKGVLCIKVWENRMLPIGFGKCAVALKDWFAHLVQGKDKKFVFQGVHANIDYGPVKEGWLLTEDKVNKVVFIGKNLDRKVRTVKKQW